MNLHKRQLPVNVCKAALREISTFCAKQSLCSILKCPVTNWKQINNTNNNNDNNNLAVEISWFASNDFCMKWVYLDGLYLKLWLEDNQTPMKCYKCLAMKLMLFLKLFLSCRLL